MILPTTSLTNLGSSGNTIFIRPSKHSLWETFPSEVALGKQEQSLGRRTCLPTQSMEVAAVPGTAGIGRGWGLNTEALGSELCLCSLPGLCDLGTRLSRSNENFSFYICETQIITSTEDNFKSTEAW